LETPLEFRTTPEQKRRQAEARRKVLVPEWRGEIRHHTTRTPVRGK